MWSLPISLLVGTTLLAVPLSRYLAWIMDGKYRAPRFFAGLIARGQRSAELDSVHGLAADLQHRAIRLWFRRPGDPALDAVQFVESRPAWADDHFHSVISFMTNTNLQHYSGDQHLSNFSQIFFCVSTNFFPRRSDSARLTAIIRRFRSEPHVGNFFVDMWRIVMYIFVPIAFVLGLVVLQQGMPMTLECAKRCRRSSRGRWERRTMARPSHRRSW